ncbi:serine hydrolase [Flavitalea sp. BT771]|uniref:serine hydrolase n=1 Tax=Flavitalea sp. BT771 TaxID=3063329 RepID=UPI0026E44017|nr:serine hydrolase [Flavitalea sp. BT771]MDO6431606.1 serine hydrolase [Flavitalea sp. BT771]MDV6220514.1 serine hydrolase [Flavitalea sp. BT771]
MMRLCLAALLLLGLCTSPSRAQSLSAGACLQRIDSIFQTQQGSFALAFSDLSTGRQLLLHEHETFHAASTMKTPVLVEIYRQAALGRLKLSDSLMLTNEFVSIADSSTYQLDSADDSETALYRHQGERRTIRELVYQMITVSSNFATNLLIQKVGAANVLTTMHGLKLDEVHVLRGVEDNKAYQKGLNNTVTAAGLMELFRLMAGKKLVNPAASDSMIRVLLDQQFNEIIPARLPAGVKVAHKTGSIKGVNHDSGIVFLPDGRKYVLVLLSRDLVDEKAAISAMAAVSEVIYKYVMQ